MFYASIASSGGKTDSRLIIESVMLHQVQIMALQKRVLTTIATGSSCGPPCATCPRATCHAPLAMLIVEQIDASLRWSSQLQVHKKYKAPSARFVYCHLKSYMACVLWWTLHCRRTTRNHQILIECPVLTVIAHLALTPSIHQNPDTNAIPCS